MSRPNSAGVDDRWKGPGVTRQLSHTPAAERERRYRSRLAHGVQFFRGDLSNDILAGMIDHGLIEPDNAADPRSIGQALALLAERWVSGQ